MRWRGAAFDGGAWLATLLALLMLLPAGFVLWFMNEAITTQAAAARRSVTEAYRAQLRLVRSRVDAHWRAHADEIDDIGDHPAAAFARMIAGRVADGLIVLDPDGRVIFPDAGLRSAAATREMERRLDRATASPRDSAALDAAADLLNDYAAPLSAQQRLAGMERLHRLAPNVVLPTEAALRLSIVLAGSGVPRPAPGRFQLTAVRNVWALGDGAGRVVALYWTGQLESMMHDLLHQVTPAGIRFIAYPPDVEADPEAISAGTALPGWQITYQPLDRTTFDDAARRQVVGYVAAGVVAIAMIVAAAVVAATAFRRQIRLARLKTDLVAAVSHELRTPVASMRVLLDGLLADAQLDQVKTREYLQLLMGENLRLGRLVENFLTFSRLERGRHQFSFAPVQVSTIASDALEAVRDRMPAGCDVRLEIEPDLPPVVADADALVVALTNLLDNAVKYTNDDKRIAVRIRRDGNGSVVFAVEDNGIGIPARERRRIFKRFYRVDRRLTRETAGVGLGLSIVELIVKAHGGSVDVQSQANVGSTFLLRLPAAAGSVAA